jgi:phage baseplate assembly protein W
VAVPQGIQVPFEVSKSRGSPVISEQEALLASSIRMILRTVPGERPFRPSFGSWLSIMVFANMTEGAAFQAAAEAKRALIAWEPRISVQDILFELVEPSSIMLTIIWSPNGAATTYRSTVEFRT